MALKVDYRNYDKLIDIIRVETLNQSQSAAKHVLTNVIENTLPNNGGMKRLNTKNVKKLQDRIRKDWLGKDGKAVKGESIPTVVFYTKTRTRVKGFGRLPFAVQAKDPKQRKMYFKKNTISSGEQLVDKANEITKRHTYGQTHFRRGRIDSKSNFRGWIKSLVFTTMAAIRSAAKISANRAGALIAGWTAAANAIGLSDFRRALPAKGQYNKTGSASFKKGHDSLKFTATNNAAPSEDQAKKHNNRFSGMIQKWFENGMDAAGKVAKKNIKAQLKNIGGNIND